MSKITLIGLSGEKENLLKKLMQLNLVDITDLSQFEEDNTLSTLHSENKFEDMLKVAQSALSILNEYSQDQTKTGMFGKKREVSMDEFSGKLISSGGMYEKALEMNRLGKEIENLNNEKGRISNKLESLACFKKLPFAFDQEGTKHVKFYMGSFLKTVDIEAVKNELEELEFVEFQEIYQTGELYYVYVLLHKSIRESVDEVLKRDSFNRIKITDEKGTCHQVIKNLESDFNQVTNELNKAITTIKNYEDDREDLKLLCDYLTYRADQTHAKEKLFETNNTFILTGYVPKEHGKQVKKELESEFFLSAQLEEVDVENDENIPTLLKNKALVTPFETITDMYSTPKYTEIDPNSIMAPFYFTFFGMMVSDAGYGLVTALICFLIVFKYKPGGTLGNLLKVIGLGGVSTLFWGIMFGGYFGDVIQLLTNGVYNPKPVLFNPIEEPMSLLILAMAFGAIHIMVGMGANMYKQFKEGKIIDPLCDQGTWIVIIIGIGVMFLWYKVGLYMAITGAVVLFLTKGRNEKNIFMKFLKGFGMFMDIPAYFADILSYARLLALGLSTGVIATVINTMGLLPGKSLIGTIAFAIIFLLGHAFNLAINLLGAYVHTSRLQYIEFFGKFYEGGGRLFNPLKIHSNYVKIK